MLPLRAWAGHIVAAARLQLVFMLVFIASYPVYVSSVPGVGVIGDIKS